MSYQEFDTLPTYEADKGQVGPRGSNDLPRWSRTTPPPPVDSIVTVRMNAIGPAKVVGYFTSHGYLGVRVKPYSPPAWYIRQNGYDATGHVFGAEIGPDLLDEPKIDGPSQAQLAALARYAKDHGRNWKHDLRNAWFDGTDEREPDGGKLRQIRNQFGPRWLNDFKLEV